MHLTPFTQVITSLTNGDAALQVDIPVDWLSGRTTFGGLTSALCLAGALQAYPDLPPLRSAQFAFTGPVTGTVNVRPSIVRRGKSSAFASVDVEGQDGVAARALLCFGADRPTRHNFVRSPATKEIVRPREELPSYFLRKPDPNFTSHFEGRIAGGARPVTPGAVPEMLVWIRHLDDKVRDDWVSLLALADTLPTPATILFPESAPISTMTWAADFFTAAPTSDEGWWLVHNIGTTAVSGYASHSMTIWGRGPEPVLAARQTVAIFS
jgi:acyl-CoA thioesterase